jgi:hypothetical protein
VTKMEKETHGCYELSASQGRLLGERRMWGYAGQEGW